jgi:hypothetical protein
MGLDMYLSAKKYHSPNFGADKFKELSDVSEIGASMEKYLPFVNLEVSMGYWRKVNAVHQWFVDNCQDGNDDCRTTYVGREQLEELKKVCEATILDPKTAETKLPTQAGFFFGGTEYDDYYLEKLKDTVEIIDRCLTIPDEWEFYYHSSW